MGKGKHTAEPWRVAPDIAREKYCPIWSASGGVRAEGLCMHTEQGLANAARIVECVNALSGVSDPAGYLERLRGVVEAAKEAKIIFNRLIGTGANPSENTEFHDACRSVDEHLRTALAALDQGE